MQPEISRPVVGSEQLPTPPAPHAERIPVLPTPEGGLDTSLERTEQAAEASAAVADMTASGASAIATAIPAADDQAVSDSPIVAADEDVIEKEWVDKAKKIILATKDDPYKRTSQVNELQKDYLKKRYGKDLGVSID